VTVQELIYFLSDFRPDAVVSLADMDEKYNLKTFYRITDIMAWSGAPILTIGRK
jgi:hypothetical protein